MRTEPRSTAFVGLADALRRDGRLPEALQALREGFRVHPDHAPGRVGLARVHVAMGHRTLAIEVLDEVVRTDAENLAAISLLCRLLLEEGRVHEARSFVERLRLVAPDDPVLALYVEHEAAVPDAMPRNGDPFDSPRLAARFAVRGHYDRAASIWRRLDAAPSDAAPSDAGRADAGRADAPGPARQALAALDRAMAGLGDVEGEPVLGRVARRSLPGVAEALEALRDEPAPPPAAIGGPLGRWARIFGRVE